MKKMIVSFQEALQVFKKDKYVLLFSFIPVLVGVLLYYYLGTFIYGDVLGWGKGVIQANINVEGWLSFFSYLFIGILTVAFYFMISWTFVLIVSLIASPFNDLISSRTEKLCGGSVPDSIQESIGRMIKRLSKTILNELKKIFFIILLSTLGFILSFILPPLSVVLSALLLAISFVDYSWSRHDFSFRDCVRDTKKQLIPYSLAGGLFLVLIAVPVINLFALPYGVVYFTILFSKQNNA